MSRFGGVVLEVKIRSYPDNKDPPPPLGDSIILGIEYSPFDAITSEAEPAQLIVEQLAIFAVRHTIYIFNDESFW